MAANVAKWTTPTTIALPSTVVDITQALSSLIDALLAILQLVRAILDVIKSFLIGSLDPLVLIIEAILAQIEGFLNDLRQIGVYLSGDLDIQYPFITVRGGFVAYERRMITRLTDRSDPTRPDFSPATTAWAVFLYTSVDSADIENLVRFIKSVAKFFGQKEVSIPPLVPVPVGVSYGTSPSLLGQWGPASLLLGEGTPPTVATVQWRMPPPPGTTSVAWPVPAPAGFLVEVSTLPDGLILAWDGPAANASMDADGNQLRQYGLVQGTELQPFRLYGGASNLIEYGTAWTVSGTTYSCPALGSDGTPRGGGIRVYAYTSPSDTTPIPLSALVSPDGKAVLQRTFFYDTSILGALLSPGQPFVLKLPYEDMPYGATFEDAGDGKVTVTLTDEPARTVYVRFSAVDASVEKRTPTNTDWTPSTFAWIVSTNAVVTAQKTGLVQIGTRVNASAKGAPSTALIVDFPPAVASEFVNTLATALVILVLTRSDMALSPTVYQENTGAWGTDLEGFAAYLLPVLYQTQSPHTYFKREGVSPQVFRKDLLGRSRALADSILANSGFSASYMEAVVEASQLNLNGRSVALSAVTWGDVVPGGSAVSILASMDVTTLEGQDMTQGVGLNPLSIGGVVPPVMRVLLSGGGGDLSIPLSRSPGFTTNPTYPTEGGYTALGAGSGDVSPVYYNQNLAPMSMVFVRNAFLDVTEDTILPAVARVLNMTTGGVEQAQHNSSQAVGAWHAYRLFPQGFPEVEAFFELIEAFLRSVSTGIRDITAMIRAYIEALEARILELEALLMRIDALLLAVLDIEVPQASALIVTGAGTDGLLQALVTAEDKPVDEYSAYGAGVVVVAGGLPTALVAILQLFFTAPSSEA